MKIQMRLIAMLVLACSVSVLAQTSTTSDSMKKDSMGKKMTMTGCISEKDGKYMLMDKKHPNGVELMSSEDLKPHVGHKMSVTGTMENQSSMGSDASNDSMKKDNMGMMGMKVDSMKMMSDHCAMPDSMMKQ